MHKYQDRFVYKHKYIYIYIHIHISIVLGIGSPILTGIWACADPAGHGVTAITCNAEHKHTNCTDAMQVHMVENNRNEFRIYSASFVSGVCIYICVYIYMYIYIHTYIYCLPDYSAKF